MKEKNEVWLIVISWIVVISAILILAMCLPGCYTQKAALRQRDKINRNYPAILANYCADNFSPKIDTLLVQGKDSIVQSYVYVDCDTVKITDTLLKTRIVKAICPPSVYRVDTFYLTVENTAKLAALQATNDKLSKDVTEANLSAAKSKKSNTIWMWLFIGLIVLDAALAYFLFKSVFKVKNLI